MQLPPENAHFADHCSIYASCVVQNVRRQEVEKGIRCRFAAHAYANIFVPLYCRSGWMLARKYFIPTLSASAA